MGKVIVRSNISSQHCGAMTEHYSKLSILSLQGRAKLIISSLHLLIGTIWRPTEHELINLKTILSMLLLSSLS
jgi:hypothetical protein